MYINADTIIELAALLGALLALFSALFTAHKWYLRQGQQDIDIKKMKEEQALLVYGILACLDGLQQLGANHTVTEVHNKIEKHINNHAHE